jgi:hypothetical protein
MRDMRCIMGGKHVRKRRSGRPRRRWKYIGRDLREIEWEYVWNGCFWLRKGPVAGSCEHGNEPSSSIKGWEFHV